MVTKMSEFTKVLFPVGSVLGEEIRSIRDKLSGRLPSIKKTEEKTINSLSQFDKFVKDHGQHIVGHVTAVDPDTKADVIIGIMLEETYAEETDGIDCSPSCTYPWFCNEETGECVRKW